MNGKLGSINVSSINLGTEPITKIYSGTEVIYTLIEPVSWNISTKVGTESDWTVTNRVFSSSDDYTETRTDNGYTYSFTINNPTDLTNATLDYTVSCADGTKSGTMTKNSSSMGFFDGLSNNTYKIQFYTSSGIGSFMKIQVCDYNDLIQQ